MDSTSSKILIVEDEPDVAAYLRAFFEDHGYSVRCARDGKAALAEIQQEKPDLITLDITMPGESGVRLYFKLQDDEQMRNLPVIVISGVPGDLRRFMETEGATNPPEDYFEKPVDRERLLRCIKNILSPA